MLNKFSIWVGILINLVSEHFLVGLEGFFSMNKFLTTTLLILLVYIGFRASPLSQNTEISGAPPYGEPESAVPAGDANSWRTNWVRPDKPPTVGIQVGHLKNSELPEELSRLIGNTGAQGGGKTEAEVNFEIAELLAAQLEEKGITVDIIPATVPPDYWADVFVAIHADGSEDVRTSGFKIAAPWRDLSGDAGELVSKMETLYAESTNLPKDPNITRNMRGYYAFAWWRYDHSIHPMTTAMIVETGFLTSAHDRQIIVGQPERSATPIAEAIVWYLNKEAIL